MRTKIALLVLSLLALCITQAGAAVPSFTGNVDTDFGPFIGDPRFVSQEDIVGDSEGPGGCTDIPLGMDSFRIPPLGQIPGSGLNIERVVTLYDCTTDTLYIGLDVCDTPTQKRAWDASGDGNVAESPAQPPPGGGILQDIFSDTGLEDYELEIGVSDFTVTTNVRVIIASFNGDVPTGAELPTVANGGIEFFSPLTPASGVTVNNFKVDGVDIELQVNGLRGAFPPNGLNTFPIRISTRSGATSDLVNEDVTIAIFDLPCTACMSITKGVSCSPDGPFLPSVDVLRGENVYFQIEVTNCGTDNLENVVITDTKTDPNGALLTCTGCTNTASCIPGTITVGDLAAGATATFVCTVPTNQAFAVTGVSPDATNTASVTGVGVLTGITLNAGPVSADVDVLVPSITCEKLVDDDDNPDPDAPGDPTPPAHELDLSLDGILEVETVYYWICLSNDGETGVDFAAGTGGDCPSIGDSLLDSPIPGVTVPPGTDVGQAFRDAIQAKYGSYVLPSGGEVCLPFGPVLIDEEALCPETPRIENTFSACGIAATCLPSNLGEEVTTSCTAKVDTCGPKICIDKKVSCSPDGPWIDSVSALRGVPVYFQIMVTNCGAEALDNVTITDTLTDTDNALLDCIGCTNGLNCIPGVTNIGSLAVDESRTFVCTVPTNPAFAVTGASPDATNTASVTATGAISATVVSDGPVSATVDLLIPSITCLKLVDDDSNPDPAQVGDPTPPTTDLNLTDSVMDIERAWYWLCVTNDGEVDVSFAPGICPAFTDDFLETADPLIPGTGVDLDALFRARLQALFGGEALPAGQSVCIAVGGIDGIQFDECVLCGLNNVFTDHFQACGFATGNDICLPPNGGECVCTDICEATVRICAPPDIEITKDVSCSPGGPFTPSVTVLRGATVYFRITVTNSGGDNLKDVVITDTLTEVDNALLACTGCTNTASCIPGSINVGDLAVCESKTFICTIPTNPNFAVIGNVEDGKNTASVTGKSVRTDATVSAGPVSATVDVRVPGIECQLLMDDDDNLADDPGDMTPPAVNLNLAVNGGPQVEHVWKNLTVCNTGEVDVSFVAGGDPNCPDFVDQLLEDFGIDVAQAFRDALVSAFGTQVLPPGECVSVTFGPLDFDETVLCPNRSFIVNRFTACGFATDADICLPPSGGEKVNTGLCQGTIMLCQPVLFQAYPGDSNGTNIHYMGHLGDSGETISSVPGVFVLVPGDNWENFVAAAQVGMQYSLKNVTLIKETPEFIQCADIYPSRVIQQQGTPNIRLRWPLMLEAPGTKWTLTIQYGTSILWDDDGILGPNIPSYFHKNVWEWKVDATLESMKLLLELFHEVAFATDEVPLISDEDLYPLLQSKLDAIIGLVIDENFRDAGLALGEFEMEVADACIAVSPRSPYPTGPGTGIANSEENPACCKILVDAEYVGFKLGLFQESK